MCKKRKQIKVQKEEWNIVENCVRITIVVTNIVAIRFTIVFINYLPKSEKATEAGSKFLSTERPQFIWGERISKKKKSNSTKLFDDKKW